MITKRHGLLLFLLAFLSHCVYAESDNPCSGPEQLLNIINRPTYADSACAVPNHERVLEQGYQSERLRGGGQLEIFPWAQLRFGLADNNELNVWIPTYNKETVAPHTGFSSITFGYKQEIRYTKNWLFSLEGYITPPSGSWTFGSKGEGSLEGIFYIALNEKWSFGSQLGIGS